MLRDISRFLDSHLYAVSTSDPVTFVGVSVMLFAVAGIACGLPSLRAARVDPMVELRQE